MCRAMNSYDLLFSVNGETSAAVDQQAAARGWQNMIMPLVYIRRTDRVRILFGGN